MPLRITLAYAPAPRRVCEVQVLVEEGATLRQALNASTLLREFPQLETADLALGIWGRRCGLDQPLRDLDRIEIYRPLLVDPKVARRARFARQGTRVAGLFARRRAGSKPGY